MPENKLNGDIGRRVKNKRGEEGVVIKSKPRWLLVKYQNGQTGIGYRHAFTFSSQINS